MKEKKSLARLLLPPEWYRLSVDGALWTTGEKTTMAITPSNKA